MTLLPALLDALIESYKNFTVRIETRDINLILLAVVIAALVAAFRALFILID